MEEYECKCGKQLKSKQGYYSHTKFCDETDVEPEKFDCVCGQTFEGKGSFKAHKAWCDETDVEPPNIEYEKVECPECGDMVAKPQLEKHKNSEPCKNGGKFETLLEKGKTPKTSDRSYGIKVNDFEKVEEGYKCSECNKVYCKSGICTHYWLNHTEDGNEHRKNSGNGERFLDENGNTWNKGLTKEDHPSIKQMAETLKKRYGTGELTPHSHSHSEETKRKLSKIRSKFLEEKGGGGFKHIDWYEVENIDGEPFNTRGTWERDTAKLLNENDILWKRKIHFEYDKGEEKEKIRTYTPDFYIPKIDVYLEIKGYFSDKDKRKIKLVREQNDIELKTIHGKNKSEILFQVKSLIIS